MVVKLTDLALSQLNRESQPLVGIPFGIEVDNHGFYFWKSVVKTEPFFNINNYSQDTGLTFFELLGSREMLPKPGTSKQRENIV